MGWVGLASMIALVRRHSFRFIAPLLLGGLAYTAGAAIELFDPPALIHRVIRSHEVFHIAVLAGLGLHWRFVWRIAGLPGPSPLASPAIPLDAAPLGAPQ